MAHIVGSWVIYNISIYRDQTTGTQYIGNWASRVMFSLGFTFLILSHPGGGSGI